MKLFETYGGTLIAAKDKRDARKVMREEWGEVFPAKLVVGKVPLSQDYGETCEMVDAQEAAKLFQRGIVPEGE